MAESRSMAAEPAGSAEALVDFAVRHLQVRTNNCTCQAFTTGYTLALRTVPDYNFIFVTRGRVIWEVEGEALEMTPGSLVLVPPAVHHRGWSLTRRMKLLSLHVEVALPGGQDVFTMLTPPRLQQVPSGCRLDRLLREAMAEFDRADGVLTHLMLRSWCRLVVMELLLHDVKRGLLTAQSIDPVVSAVLEELHRRVGQAVRHQDLAAWSGYSPQHLNRVFRRELGVTPLQYLARLRMEQAAELVAAGVLNLREVGRRVGIDDPYYFSRLFRRHFGISATAYRQTAGEGLTGDSKSPSHHSPGPLSR